jgi:hypothetical protein
MKVELLCLDAASMPSPISKGVVEIRINIHLARVKPDNMTLESHEDTTSGHSS